MLFSIFHHIFLWPYVHISTGEILSNGIAESKDVSIIILIDSPKVFSIKIAQKYTPTVFLLPPA